MAQKSQDWHVVSADDDPTILLDEETCAELVKAAELGFDLDSFEVSDVEPPKRRFRSRSQVDTPTLEIPTAFLEDADARTPGDWERVSVEMEAVDSLDILLQSVDTVLEGESEATEQNTPSPDPDLLHRNTRPVASKPQPYKAGDGLDW